jgi:hypothetical protein
LSKEIGNRRRRFENMRSLYIYFKFLFANEENLIAQWKQLSEEKVSKKYKEAIARELQKRDYHYDGANWVKFST